MTLCTLSDMEDANIPTDGDLARALHNPYAVRAWLEAKHPDEVVGSANSPMDCTLHHYLADTTGQAISVRTTSYRVEDNPWNGLYQMPRWAARFVIYHDTINGRRKTAVTAAEALRAFALAVDPMQLRGMGDAPNGASAPTETLPSRMVRAMETPA